jgi:15-cis-phytoene synthase
MAADPSSPGQLDALVRRVDEDRWLASRFAAPPERARLVVLYAINHEIAHAAEAAREPGLGAIRLQWWRDGLGEIAAGSPVRAHPALTALKAIAPRFAAKLEPLADARLADLEAAPFAAWNELEHYVDRTGGLLLELALEACGVAAETAPQHAFARLAGRAWGFTGLMRAAGHWRLRGRTLLPPGAHMEDLRLRAADAYAAARSRAGVFGAQAFPAFGYVALAKGYQRALAAGRSDRPLLARQARLVWASARGRL